MLWVEEITSGYIEGIDILKEVSLRVEKGSLTGVIGPNGAGKSTLLKTVFGLLHPRRGRILFKGEEIQHRSPHYLKRMGISFMLQDQSAFPQLTVNENLLIGTWVFRKDKALVKQRLDEVYGLFPMLADRKNQRANALSGGILRMLCIGKELISRPGLLLLDEPSCGLAPKIVTRVYALLRKIAAAGTAILLVDQNIMKALEVSDHVYMLDMGRVRQQGPKVDFEARIREIIRESFTG